MKILFSRCFCLLVAALLLLPYIATAQPGTIDNANGTLLCPNRPYIFSSTSAPSTSNCSVNWTVTNGNPIDTNPTTAGIMCVSFADVLAGKATLYATYSNCSNTIANGQSPLETIFIRSITGEQLGAITYNGSTTATLNFGDDAPVTLEVPQLAIPRHNDAPARFSPVYAQGYEWTIPVGWKWPNGTVSTGRIL